MALPAPLDVPSASSMRRSAGRALGSETSAAAGQQLLWSLAAPGLLQPHPALATGDGSHASAADAAGLETAAAAANDDDDDHDSGGGDDGDNGAAAAAAGGTGGAGQEGVQSRADDDQQQQQQQQHPLGSRQAASSH